MRLCFFVGLAAAAASAPTLAEPPARTVRTVIVHRTVNADGKVETRSVGQEDAQAMMAACGARHFETSAETNDGGKKRISRVKLCAKPGEDNASWVRALEQAKTTLASNDRLTTESRTRLVADLDAEIARTKAAARKTP